MTTSLRYTGPAQQYTETAVTGRFREWIAGQQQDVTDAEATLLLATGSFQVQPWVDLRTQPVRIAGTFAVGQVLTAVLLTGYSATGWQWTRTVNGTKSNIAGATSSIYTVAPADLGATIGLTPAGLTFVGFGGDVVQAA